MEAMHAKSYARKAAHLRVYCLTENPAGRSAGAKIPFSLILGATRLRSDRIRVTQMLNSFPHFPAHPIAHPLPRHLLGVLRWWRRNRTLRELHFFPSIRLGQALEDFSLFLHPAVIAQQTQAVLERVEFKLPVHVVRIPIREPAHALLNRCRYGNFQPLGLLLLRQAFDARIEFLR